MKEALLTLFATTFETIGESKLEQVLQQLHDKDKVKWEAALRGGLSLITALQPFIDNSKTPIDNLFCSAILEAIQISAKNNGLTL